MCTAIYILAQRDLLKIDSKLVMVYNTSYMNCVMHSGDGIKKYFAQFIGLECDAFIKCQT